MRFINLEQKKAMNAFKALAVRSCEKYMPIQYFVVAYVTGDSTTQTAGYASQLCLPCKSGMGKGCTYKCVCINYQFDCHLCPDGNP